VTDAKPPTSIELDWTADLRFEGRSGGIALTLDSAGRAGPSPMQALAFALAGCMAMDVVHILRKGRHPLTGLHARLTGQRAPDDPRRFLRIDLHFSVAGGIAPAAIDRAVALSRAQYCSVLHSLRSDIDLVITHDP
jgi:putative redox protein